MNTECLQYVTWGGVVNISNKITFFHGGIRAG